MVEAVFLVVLGAFAILSTAGWFVISSPTGKRRKAQTPLAGGTSAREHPCAAGQVAASAGWLPTLLNQSVGTSPCGAVLGEQIPNEREVKMLGRHVYRVYQEEDRWTVLKEGDSAAPGAYGGRDEAVKEACRRAEADQPSKVIVDGGDGAILEEHLFGSDLSQELNSTSR